MNHHATPAQSHADDVRLSHLCLAKGRPIPLA